MKNDYTSQADLVRNLRGAPASIVLILLLSGRPHTQQELEEATSYSDKPIRRAIHFLACRGVVNKAGSGWSLQPDFRRRLVERFRPSPPARPAASFAAADPEPNDAGDALANRRITAEEREAELASLLRHMGILSPAFDALLARGELLADPDLARAWWWYVLTQEWSKNRPGLVIARLNERRDPPAAFLALARSWPAVSVEDRIEMRELHWRSYTSAQMAHHFADRYPRMTAAVFGAFQSLYDVAPEELGF